MVLQVLYTAVTAVLPVKYWPHAAAVAAVLVVIYAYAQGRSTTRERDLHARIVILTVSLYTAVALSEGGRIRETLPEERKVAMGWFEKCGRMNGRPRIHFSFQWYSHTTAKPGNALHGIRHDDLRPFQS